MNEVIECLGRIPRFKSVSAESFDIERLGGLTNLVYRIGLDGKDYLLRIPGKGTEQYINRRQEFHDACVAADAGVSARVLHFCEDDGLMLAEYIEGETLNAERFKDPGSVYRSAKALNMLHNCARPFAKTFDVFQQIDEYLEHVAKLGASLPEGYSEAKTQADAARQALAKRPVPLVPSHCDPLAENFIDDGGRVWIVDWEYAGNNDPMWDLGDLSVEAGFDSEQDRLLLESYFGGIPPREQVARMVMYKALCDLLWTLWGAVQNANDNPAEDFWTYTCTRFERCRDLMSTESFRRNIEILGDVV